jgi:hypothetical protein
MGDSGVRMVASGIGAFLAETATLPMDVVKVRMQVQNASTGGMPRFSGFTDCFMTTAKEEGIVALWKGLAPALVRQVSYTSFSLVIYEPIRDFWVRTLPLGNPDGSPSFLQRLLAGGTAGGFAISVFNPAEVVKTQVQTAVTSLSMRDVVVRVWERDGLVGFWAGVKPNVLRTFLVNAAELGTYDEAKTRIKPFLGNGLLTHVSASGCAGFASACVSTPADVVKTRFMNQAGGESQSRGILSTGLGIVRNEGFTALYKGFTAICIRKLVWCAAFFVTYERIREEMNQRKV